jgi:hypothetical protein
MWTRSEAMTQAAPPAAGPNRVLTHLRARSRRDALRRPGPRADGPAITP